jgi:precorrin-2 methylase
MIIVNTTFVIHKSIEIEFVSWLKEVYIPTALSSKIFSNSILSKILTEVDPESTSYAFQLHCDTLESAQKWHNEIASSLNNRIGHKWGNYALFFTTYMESLS